MTLRKNKTSFAEQNCTHPQQTPRQRALEVSGARDLFPSSIVHSRQAQFLFDFLGGAESEGGDGEGGVGGGTGGKDAGADDEEILVAPRAAVFVDDGLLLFRTHQRG